MNLFLCVKGTFGRDVWSLLVRKSGLQNLRKEGCPPESRNTNVCLFSEEFTSFNDLLIDKVPLKDKKIGLFDDGRKKKLGDFVYLFLS